MQDCPQQFDGVSCGLFAHESVGRAYTTTMLAFVATFFMDTECVLVVHNIVLADHFGSGSWFSC